MSTAVNWPESLVFKTFATLVSRFVSVTLALATAAPEGSMTVPTKVASCANPCAAKRRTRAANSNIRRRSHRLAVRPILPACVGERDFIVPASRIALVGDVLRDRTARAFRERLRCYIHPMSVVKNKIDIVKEVRGIS